MDTSNVQSQLGITLVGNGILNPADLGESVARAPIIVAADGGANHCLTAGHEPRFVIGDLDSVESETRHALPETTFIQIDEQDTTDFEKCLTRISAPFVLAVGFSGGRLDHALSALSVLAQRVGPPTFMLSGDDVVFAAPKTISIDLVAGTRMSLFPMASVTGTSKGLRWPIDGLTMTPDGTQSTSNEVTGPVELTFDQPGCLVFTPRSCLDAVLAAVSG